jgi:hypothetical protein
VNLVWNWKTVLSEAWSIKLSAIAALIGGFQQAMSFIPAGLFGLSPEVWSAVATILGVLSVAIAGLVVPVARLVDQGLANETNATTG